MELCLRSFDAVQIVSYILLGRNLHLGICCQDKGYWP